MTAGSDGFRHPAVKAAPGGSESGKNPQIRENPVGRRNTLSIRETVPL